MEGKICPKRYMTSKHLVPWPFNQQTSVAIYRSLLCDDVQMRHVNEPCEVKQTWEMAWEMMYLCVKAWGTVWVPNSTPHKGSGPYWSQQVCRLDGFELNRRFHYLYLPWLYDLYSLCEAEWQQWVSTLSLRRVCAQARARRARSLPSPSVAFSRKNGGQRSGAETASPLQISNCRRVDHPPDPGTCCMEP